MKRILGRFVAWLRGGWRMGMERACGGCACGARKPIKPDERGMTLVEIMVVVVIISLVAGVVGVAVFGQLERAQVKTAQTQIKQLGYGLDLYKLSFRKYPSSAEGLPALVQSKDGQPPIMATLPKDPWGNDYSYAYPGSHNQGGFDLMSNGPDGVAGGTDDIGNWTESTGQ